MDLWQYALELLRINVPQLSLQKAFKSGFFFFSLSSKQQHIKENILFYVKFEELYDPTLKTFLEKNQEVFIFI